MYRVASQRCELSQRPLIPQPTSYEAVMRSGFRTRKRTRQRGCRVCGTKSGLTVELSWLHCNGSIGSAAQRAARSACGGQRLVRRYGNQETVTTTGHCGHTFCTTLSLFRGQGNGGNGADVAMVLQLSFSGRCNWAFAWDVPHQCSRMRKWPDNKPDTASKKASARPGSVHGNHENQRAPAHK